MEYIDFDLELLYEYVELNQLFKFVGLCDSGGVGKVIVVSGVVIVDGVLEMCKICKICFGQCVVVDEEIEILVYVVG